MSTAKRNAPVANIVELRTKLAEKMAAFENGEISVGEAKAFAGLAGAIVNTLKIEIVNNAAQGNVKNIEFLNEIQKPIEIPAAATITPLSQAFKNTTAPRTTKNSFSRPTYEELHDYFQVEGVDYLKADEEATKFLNFFDANGWVVGSSRAPMKDWRAAVKSWIYRMGDYKKPMNGVKQINGNGKRGTSEARVEVARQW